MKPGPQHTRILAYLYGGMSPAERTAFEAACEQNAELRRQLEAERQFQERYPPRSSPALPDAALDESRLRLRTVLMQTRVSPSRLSAMGDAIRNLIPPHPFALALAPLLVILGVFIGHTWLPTAPADLQPNMDITAIDIVNFDATTGQIELNVSGRTSRILKGDYRQPAIQKILIDALQPDQSPDIRLETVDLLQPQAGHKPVRDALIAALINDENPGVRLKAIEALKTYIQDARVRQALRTALLSDPNPGVRIEAIDALQRVPDPATADVFRVQAQRDSNAYIRIQADQTLQKWSTQL